MNVVGHGHVAYDHKAIMLADFLEHGQKQIPPLRARHPRLLGRQPTGSDERASSLRQIFNDQPEARLH